MTSFETIHKDKNTSVARTKPSTLVCSHRQPERTEEFISDKISTVQCKVDKQKAMTLTDLNCCIDKRNRKATAVDSFLEEESHS
jgi:hypothetical protein